MKQKKPDNRRLCRILLPAMALLTALAFTVTTGMLANSAALDSLFGRGERTVTALDSTGGLDAAYYPQRYANAGESLAAAAALSRQISGEGIVLLKNNGLLPLGAGTELSPFGLRYRLPFYGGSGSSAIDAGEDYVVTPSEGLHAAFSQINDTLEDRLFQAAGGDSLADDPNVAASRPLSGASGEHILYEFAPSLYSGMEASCRGTVGVVFLGRQTGENQDASTVPYDDGAPHMLALSAAERETVAFAKAHCAAVVVVLASSSPMEVAELEDDGGVDAILWLGGAGCSGYASLGDILAGNVTPSGRTPDLWPTDFKRSPTFPNQDDGSERFTYANAYTTLVGNRAWEARASLPFHEYEEGVYLGYRYYETAWDTGSLPDYHDRGAGVLYPFGHGLSYTRFSQEIVAFSDQGSTVSLTVRVENRGAEHAGKDVVQVYVSAPYTALDQQYRVEKPTAQLAAFAKTGLLSPGACEDVTLSFPKEDMASYCSTRDNGDGTTGCYLLEQGTYQVSIRADSHEVLDEKTVQIPATIWYDNQNPRQSELDAQLAPAAAGMPYGYLGESTCQAATNQFEQLGAYLYSPQVGGAVPLSRADWAGTQPTAPTDADRTASVTVIRWAAESDSTAFQYETDSALGNGPGSLVYQAEAPASKADNGLVLADLRGRSYRDPLWDLLLDQLNYENTEELRRCLFEAGYRTGAVASIGKPETVEHDGSQGLTLPDVSGRNWIKGTCAYPSAPVMAATWNQPLLYALGDMVGQEALVAGINGWYAPALNLHRSPFCGRAAEYFSEDPLLTGRLGAQVLSGAEDAGLYCVVKHIGLMDTEAHRNPHTAAWLTEQTLREIYLRPFELALKEAVKTIRYVAEESGTLEQRTMRAGDFLMAGDCAVGTDWAAASYGLLTEVVRGEWGFQGAVVSDMHLNGNNNQVDLLLRAGCDALMSTESGGALTVGDTASPTGQSLLRGAVKNLCYPLVNSNLMQDAAPGAVIHSAIPVWKVCLIAADAAAGLLVAAAGLWLGLQLWRDRRRD